MRTKQNIIDAIRQTAKENGGVPIGRKRFEKETGITQWDCNKYWATFGDAQREAGFTPNTFLNPAHDETFLFESLITLIRELSRFPTRSDVILRRNKDSKFPNPSSIYRRFDNKKDIMATRLSEYAIQKGYGDIVELCKPVIKDSIDSENFDDYNDTQELGEVYLFKSGRYYKLGKTNDTVRRGNEIRIQLPERTDLIHSIRTDDPSGVEAYWHKRFESKRMNGEWFDLNSADIKAFKRWRKIV
ncbi:MAG: GIY-YIG nuclease family protein [Candidatus Paceibacterota bacterium]